MTTLPTNSNSRRRRGAGPAATILGVFLILVAVNVLDVFDRGSPQRQSSRTVLEYIRDQEAALSSIFQTSVSGGSAATADASTTGSSAPALPVTASAAAAHSTAGGEARAGGNNLIFDAVADVTVTADNNDADGSSSTSSLRTRSNNDTTVAAAAVVQFSSVNSSKILPKAVDLWRRGVSLMEVYNFTGRNFSRGPDSVNWCGNATATLYSKRPDVDGGCLRLLARAHKMGYTMNVGLVAHFRPHVQTFVPSYDVDYIPKIRQADDFRNVLVLRNIYSSLVSGYLYHLSGHECWLNEFGRPMGKQRRRETGERWVAGLSYKLQPPNQRRSICRYMADEGEYAAMRAYMEWVFHHYYSGILSLWALAEQVKAISKRTMTVCYEDLVVPELYPNASNAMVDFLFNSTDNHKPWVVMQSSESKERAQRHATTHNSTYHEHLLELIREIDYEHYGGDVEWLDSVLPC